MLDTETVNSDINRRLDVVRANMIRCEATHPPIEPSRLEFPLLKDRIVIITGASGDLGGAMTVECLVQGAVVYNLDRQDDHKTRQLLSTRFGKIPDAYQFLQADATDRKRVQELITRVIAKHDRINGLVLNAGTCQRLTFPESSVADLQTDFANCVIAAFVPLQLALPYLQAQGKGEGDFVPGSSVVFTTSISAACGGDKSVTPEGKRSGWQYTFVKAGLEGMMKWLASDDEHFTPYRIRLNAIAPAGVHTEISKNSLYLPIRRLGRRPYAEDVAVETCLLLSRATNYKHGTTSYLQGGWYDGIG
ncbi:SDR family NAD(P)-dependent oxidoreductase [Planctomycetota bacterium]